MYCRIFLKENIGFIFAILPSFAPLAVPFKTPTVSKDLPLYYFWEFGDSGTSDQNPVHYFSQKGRHTYTVRLFVTNNACGDTASGTVTVSSFDPLKDSVYMRLATVEQNRFVHIYWEQNPAAIRNVLLRSVDGNNYIPIDTLGVTDAIDKTVDVQNQYYHYKVMGLDSCNGNTALSQVATTILLQGQSQNDDAEAQLNWNNYQLFRYGLKGYMLIKDNQPISPVFTNTGYTDPDFFTEQIPEHIYLVFAFENPSPTGNDTIKSESNILHILLKTRLWIPNVFTPNDNNLNDSFVVHATGPWRNAGRDLFIYH